MNPLFRQTLVMLSLLVVCLLVYTVTSTLYYRGHPLYRNDTDPVKVLITAYQRSGSSFIGRVLGYRNDTFYIFEPLWHKSTLQSHHSVLRYLQDIYRCNIAKTNELLSRAYAAPSWSVYRNCISTEANKTACLEKESLFCKTKQNIVSKVIRVSLESAKPLLSIIPDLRIIHLLRDPRAIINSRVVTTSWSRVNFKSAELVENNIQNAKKTACASVLVRKFHLRVNFSADNSAEPRYIGAVYTLILCSKMQSDIYVGKQLMTDFPDRVRFIQYEDFHDPVNKASKLYQYLGLRYTNDSVHQFIKTKINPRINEKQQTEGFHPFVYRKTLPWKYVLLVNKYCSVVYEELGLVQFNTEADFKNESISVIQTSLPFGLD